VPRNTVPVFNCPETGEKVTFRECMGCPRFQVWDEDGSGFQRCWYEHESPGRLTEEGWLDRLRETDAETYERLIEEKQNRERVLTEIEAERAELDRLRGQAAKDESLREPEQPDSRGEEDDEPVDGEDEDVSEDEDDESLDDDETLDQRRYDE